MNRYIKWLIALCVLFAYPVWGATVNPVISNSNQDWTNFLDQPGFANPAVTSTSYYIGRSASRAYSYSLTFTNISIPQAATIDTAYMVSWTAIIPDSASGLNIKQTLWGYNADTGVLITDSTMWRTAFNNKTTASTTEKVPITAATWTGNTRFTMYDSVKAIIQEIVNRAGWASGNSITLLSRCDTATTTSNHRLLLSNYDRSSTQRDSLVIVYTASGGGSPSATPNVVIRSATIRNAIVRCPPKLYRREETWKW